MGAALQVYFTRFDDAFFKLPEAVRSRIEAKLDDVGTKLSSFPHYRLTGSSRYRLRIGDYRVIYTFDIEKDEIYLLGVGHRREIYRNL